MYNKSSSRYNAGPRIDRVPLLNRVKAKAGEYDNLLSALMIYVQNLKDDGLETFEYQLDDMFLKGRAPILNKKLVGLTLDGIKPDAYILVRNGQLILDFSYHYLLRIVAEKYRKKIETVMLEREDLSAIETVNPIDQVVTFNTAKYTELYLSREGFNLKHCAACLVICRDIETNRASMVLYRIGDLISAGSAHAGASFRLDSDSSPSTKHKNFMMIRKTAIRTYVRDNFTDLREMHDIEYPESTDEYDAVGSESNESSGHVESDRISEFEQQINEVSNLDELDLVAEKIKSAKLTATERKSLMPLFMERKKALTEVKASEGEHNE